MKLFIVAVPLFSPQMDVNAYRLSYKRGDQLFGMSENYQELDGAMNSPGVDLINLVGLEVFTGGKPIFVDINNYCLLANVPDTCYINHDLFVCILSKDVPLKQMYFDKCSELKANGFKIALENIDYTKDSTPLYKLSDYVIINARSERDLEKLKMIRGQFRNIGVVFSNVNDNETFHDLSQTRDASFQGSFYSRPHAKAASKIAPIKANALRLISMANNEDFDLDRIAAIIQQDASLSISLLSFINSPAIGLKTRVNSINQAVALLGQKEVRKWITVSVSASLGENRPSELTKISLIRAKFAENLATPFGMSFHAPSLFLVGLFSLLDIILEQPMDVAVEKVALTDKLKEALLTGKGRFADVLNLIKFYENADWNEVACIMIAHQANVEDIHKAFIDALLWYKNLLNVIS